MQWNQVTWYSRLGAIILFVGVIPALCFYIGMQYERFNEANDNQSVEFDFDEGRADFDVLEKTRFLEGEFNSIKMSSEANGCPKGLVDEMILNNIIPELYVTCHKQSTFLYNNEEAQVIIALYGYRSKEELSPPKKVWFTIFPSGRITFDNNFVDLKKTLTNGAQEFVIESTESENRLLDSNFVELIGLINGPNVMNQYCGTFKVLPPFKGEIITCGFDISDTSSSGVVEWDETYPKYEESLSRALDYAEEIYHIKQPLGTKDSNVDTNQYKLNAVYFNQEGKYWVFYVENGYINSDRMIKVDTEGNLSCINGYGNLGMSCP